MSQEQLATDISEAVDIPLSRDRVGLGEITAADYCPSFLSLRLNGKEALKLTEEMGRGKFEITDEMILEISKRRPMLQAAFVGLMNQSDATTVGSFKKTMNVLLNEFVNGLHEYLAEQIAPGQFAKVKAEHTA